MPRGTRSSRRAGRQARPGRRRGVAGRSKAGGSSRRSSKAAGKRPGGVGKKGAAKKRKNSRNPNMGKGRVRGRQSGGGGKSSSLTARRTGRTLGVALAGRSAPGARGAWEFGSAETRGGTQAERGAPEFTGPAEAAESNPSQSA